MAKKNIIVVFFSLIAAVLILFTTQKYNPGVTPDSVTYIEVAQNIKNHNGVVNYQGKIVTLWPPFYPLVLAGTSNITGLEVVESGRYLNTLLIALLFFVFNLILKQQNLNIFTLLFLNTFLLVSRPITVYSNFWSETLFLVLLLVIVYLILRWKKINQTIYLIFTGFLCGILVLTRYAGLGIFGGIVIFLLLDYKKRIKNRAKNLFLLLSTFLVPIIPWITYIKSFNQNITNRNLAFHPVTFSKIKDLFYTLGSWLFPFNPKYVFIIGIPCCIALLIIINNKTTDTRSFILSDFYKESIYFILIGSLIIIYFIFLLSSISLVGAGIPLNNRILAPTFLLFLLFFTPYLNSILQSRINEKILLITFSIILISPTIHSINFWYDFYQTGWKFTGKAWQNSATIKYLKKHKIKKIYTNKPGAIKFHLENRFNQIRFLPCKISPHTHFKNKNYKNKILKLKQLVKNDEYFIVYFNEHIRNYLPDKEEILSEFNNFNKVTLPDGIIINSKN